MTVTTEFEMQSVFDTQSDGRLLAEVAARGAPECFERLVQRHSGMVLGVCRRQLDDVQDAEDAAQAVFLVLWHRADSLVHRSSIASWLHTVARNVCRNAKRARHARRTHEREVGLRLSTDTSPERDGELVDIVDEEVGCLPEKYRLAILLFYHEGRSQNEIAALLDTKPATVATRLNRARDMLRSRLARRGFAVSATALGSSLASPALASPALGAFISTATRAATEFAGGTLTESGVLSAEVIALSKGALGMYSQIKWAVACLLVLGTLALGVGVAFFQQPERTLKLGTASRLAAPLPSKQVGTLPPVEGKKEFPFRVIDQVNAYAVRTKRLDSIGPKLVIGQRPDSSQRFRDSLIENTFRLEPPRESVETVAVLVGPRLNSGEEWHPSRILMDGTKITIVVESWRDNGPRRKNIPFDPIWVFSLGKLKARMYECELRVEVMRYNYGTNPRPKHYRHEGGLVGEFKFRVAAKNAPAAKKTPTLAKAKLKEWKAKRAIERQRIDDRALLQRELSPRTRPLVHYLLAGNFLPKPAIRIGTCDYRAFWNQRPTQLAHMAVLKKPTLGDDVFISILGPVLNLGERMQVRSVRWEGRKAILEMALWRDAGERGKNVLRHPYLLLPLHDDIGAKLTEPGDYEVEVEWTLFYSPDLSDGVYTRYSPNDLVGATGVVEDVVKPFLAQVKLTSRAKFSLPESRKE